MSRPLSPEAAAVINEFKRSGQFDKLRKSLFQEFKESVSPLLQTPPLKKKEEIMNIKAHIRRLVWIFD